jgi:hypothetical protein
MGNLVNRSYESSVSQPGDTVNIPIPPTLVANNIAEGGSVQPQAPNLGNAAIVLNTHAEATFQIPDVTKVLAVPDLLKLYMQPAVIALAEKIESDLLALYPQFTGNSSVGIPGSALTESVIDTAETMLFNQKVPASESKYLVVDGAGYSALRQIPRFSEYRTAGEAGLRAMVDGSIGKIKDFFVFRSQFVPKTGSAPATTHNLAFTKNSIGLVVRRLPQPLPGTGAIAEYAEFGNFGIRVMMSYKPDTLSQQFTVDVLYGAAVLRNKHGVQVES